MNNYNTAMVSRITGLTKRQIGYWDSRNFIKPSVREASGQGSIRLYSFSDLVQLNVAKVLRKKGVSLQKMRKAVSYLEQHMPDVETPLLDMKFITDGETLFVITKDDQEVIDIIRRQSVFAITLGSMIEELKGEVKHLHEDRMYKVIVRGKKYSVILHPEMEDGGYWVECPDVPGCVSQGDTVRETLEMIRDALKGCLEVAPGKKKAEGIS